jgi:hypothetical protein
LYWYLGFLIFNIELIDVLFYNIISRFKYLLRYKLSFN